MSKLSDDLEPPDHPYANGAPLARYFPIAIITLIRVNRARYTRCPLSRAIFQIIWRGYETVWKWPLLPRERFALIPSYAGRTFARLATREGPTGKGKGEGEGKEEGISCRRGERVNYIFVLPILGKPSTGLLSSSPSWNRRGSGAVGANNAVTLSRARSSVIWIEAPPTASRSNSNDTATIFSS